jgi:uncharacterized membrane protein
LGWAGAAIGCAAYAVLAHYAASAPAPGLFEACVFIVPLMAFALVVAWRSPRRGWWLALWFAAGCALWLARDRLAAGTQWVLLLQHVGINAMLCLGFGRTLAPGSVPLVSRMAAIVHGVLSPRLVRYTRAVTWAWTLFFGATAVLSVLLFALAPATLWSAFVNLLSLPLLAAMFGGEYLVRMLAIPREERSSFFQAVGAYREFARRKNAGPH